MYHGFYHVNNLILFIFLNLFYRARLWHKRNPPQKKQQKSNHKNKIETKTWDSLALLRTAMKPVYLKSKVFNHKILTFQQTFHLDNVLIPLPISVRGQTNISVPETCWNTSFSHRIPHICLSEKKKKKVTVRRGEQFTHWHWRTSLDWICITSVTLINKLHCIH